MIYMCIVPLLFVGIKMLVQFSVTKYGNISTKLRFWHTPTLSNKNFGKRHIQKNLSTYSLFPCFALHTGMYKLFSWHIILAQLNQHLCINIGLKILVTAFLSSCASM